MSFSEILKSTRQSRSLSQGQVAYICEVSQQVISHWEQGKRQPSFDRACTVLAQLGVWVAVEDAGSKRIVGVPSQLTELPKWEGL